MKIDGQYTKLPVQDKAVQKGKEKEPQQVEKKKPTVVSKTDNTFSLTRIKDRIEAEPDINIDKVNEIKAKLKNGEYQIDTEKLAKNIIKDSLIEDV